mmetsp:Transcript_42521/g.51637  ORF Transcript_42521/g.51637 Transcript_42521/m.51637 type:complete len:102 (+) Transcript_42521:218-523(+)|eukprot:CAMPEP_0197848140 /NCGR_PEP_ID=MMETSP1438-20131217/7949_1 /TAXON_ID=1461541 /ORGANISM="Pterosperma sp., Strain CCMP1384" /LENGTH=101 /DNA_ID=CAMNT_0043460279 /DNA_START=205 /DNA_END=510 /DNA_ORIENTATION=-
MAAPGVAQGGRVSLYYPLANAWAERVKAEKRAVANFNAGLANKAVGPAETSKVVHTNPTRSESKQEMLAKTEALFQELENEKSARREMEKELNALRASQQL